MLSSSARVPPGLPRPRREDYEFGLRLVQADLTFAFVPDAVGYHYDETDARGSLQRIYYEGRGDVLIGRRHPELRPNLPLFHFRAPRGLFQHSVHALAFDAPRIGEALALALARALRLAEGLRLARPQASGPGRGVARAATA